MKHGNKNSYSKNKEYVGRWGNEYDTNFNINLSKKFTQSNGAWTKLVVQLENWSDNYDNNVGDYKIDLTELYIEMGNVPMFTGAFKDAKIVAGKKKWDAQQVEILDYYYQDVKGTGLGLEGIRLWNGSLNLTYISNDFKDGELSNIEGKKAEDVRAYKAKYTHGADNPKFEKTFSDFKEYYEAHCNDNTAPYDGIMELLKELKLNGIKLAIVSNKLDPAVKELNQLYFKEYMTSAVGEMEEEGIRKKPAPDMVQKALKELQVSADEAIYVGDSDVDIATAKNSGLECVSVTWGFRDVEFLKEHGATNLIDEPVELLNYV